MKGTPNKVNTYFQILFKRLAMTGFHAYSQGMKALITQATRAQIAEKLIHGENPNNISKDLGIELNQVLMILGDGDFSARCLELYRNQARGLALVALHNISRIAFDPVATAATQLKASKILADIAREMDELHRDDLEPSNMTQNQLAERLKALQKEAILRAKPIDTGVIDLEPVPSLDDMLE